MPPDYTLSPPRPGASRPQELSAQQAAEAALVPEAALSNNAGPDSPGQQALVAQAGPPAPADIRQRIQIARALSGNAVDQDVQMLIVQRKAAGDKARGDPFDPDCQSNPQES